MKLVTLMENTARCSELFAEHGLSLYIETETHKILFDAGQSSAFADNAGKLGVDLKKVDFAVLSHGHYDHSGGLGKFLEINKTAPVYVSRYAFEPHYSANGYIGVDSALKNSEQIRYVAEEISLAEGITLCQLEKAPMDTAGLLVEEDGERKPDDFRHEQYLLMEEGGKLIYRISADSVPWATTTAQKLASEYVLSPNYVAIETMKVETKGRTYDFLLFTEEVPYTDENGNITSYLEPRAYFEGEYLDPDQFYIFFQDMALMEVAGEDSGTATTSEFMKVTYTYVTDRPADTVVFCLTDTQKVIPLVNSQKTGYVYRNYVQALAENLESLVEGKEIAAVNTSDN